MIRRSLFMLMALVLLFTFLPQQSVEASKRFYDVRNYQEEIGYLSGQGIINGYEDGSFRPESNLTRLQAVTMILREQGVRNFAAPNPHFTDMSPGSYGYDVVSKAVDMGIIGGKTDKHGRKFFDPSASLTRGQMAKILTEGYQLQKDSDVYYKDVPARSGYRDYVSTLANADITTGYADGTFNPNTKLSRQHFAVFMARLLNEDFKPGNVGNVPELEGSTSDLEVHFIDVGQGDAALIQTPEGQNILIDAGIKSAGQKVVSFLKEKDVGKIDMVIATHPHADHIGGLIEVLKRYPVGKFVDSGKPHTTQTYLEMLTLIDEKDIEFVVPVIGQEFKYGNMLKMTVVHVDSTATNLNNASVSIRAEYGSLSILLTGDAEKEAEAGMLRSGLELRSTIYKAGHHGSNSSSTQAFVDVVKPEVSILSYGKGNQYGHPHAEIVERLQRAGSKIYSTEQVGDITLKSNGKLYTVSGKQHVMGEAPDVKPVPKPTPKPEVKPVPKPETGATGKININTASFEELQEINGVGAVIAQRIIDYRKAIPFNTIADLRKVKGIGAVTYEKMSVSIRI